MTIVFGGIDLPVYEMLFIVSVMLLCGLFVMMLGIFYILKELRELKNALQKEQENILLFTKDIADLENFEGQDKSDREMKKYIKENLDKGYKWEQLKAHLIGQGWDGNKIEEIYKKLN